MSAGRRRRPAHRPLRRARWRPEQVFKNVTVLKGIPVDEFMGTMGVFSAALGFSCEDCHTASSNDWANYAKDVSPRKTMARQMVTMMQGVNKQYFGGRQVVTCFTCHRGSNRPKVTASLDILYGAPPPGRTRRARPARRPQAVRPLCRFSTSTSRRSAARSARRR